MDFSIIYTISHILGVAIGAGGAFAADYTFFQSVRDRRITKTEMSFIENSSKMVWLGLLILALSGLGLFFQNPDQYLSSSKFITKMIIVLIIAINGVFFHLSHTPRLKKCLDQDLRKNKIFSQKRDIFILSGVISVVSWLSAIILGSLRSISYSVGGAMSFYIAIVIVAFIIGRFITKKYF